MNIFYQLPEKITTYEQVEEYYANRKYLIVLYDWLGWEDKTDAKFMERLSTEELRRYYNICDFPHEKEFMRNTANGKQEYIKDTDAQYEKFWNYDGNYDLLSKFVRPTSSLFDLSRMERFLRKHQSSVIYNKIMKYQPKRTPVSLQEAIAICEEETSVYVKPAWSLFALLRYKLFYIYDARQNGKFIGSFYFKESKGQPLTYPLGHGTSLVKSPMTHQLTHELIHTVQNCFTPFYKNPKELVELPAMLVEKKYSGCSQEYIDRNIALSIADIKSDDPYTFDKVFNEESRSTPPIKVSNRFFHYVHYPKQYYAYALGLIVPEQNITYMVRDVQVCKAIVEKLLE